MKGLAFTRRNLVTFAAVGVASLGGAGTLAQTAFASGTLNGAGSTLVYPFEQEWAQGYQAKTHNTVNYNAVGSGQGITDISNGTVDFGASDAPLSTSQQGTCHGCENIPWAVSATGVGFNVPGVHSLKLTGAILADIYLGQITTWNSPQIAAVNKGVHLPSLKITPIYRSDGSGDTYAFTNYLSEVSGAWAHGPGYATSVGFNHGQGAKGNSGMVATIQSTSGSIGYAAVSYLIATNGSGLSVAQVRNAAGKYEYPNLSQIENAASSVKHVPSNLALHIVDPPKSAKIAYPISTFTYAVVPRSGNKQAGLLKSFLNYVLTTGQRNGPSLDFAKLPAAVTRASEAAVSGLS